MESLIENTDNLISDIKKVIISKEYENIEENIFQKIKSKYKSILRLTNIDLPNEKLDFQISRIHNFDNKDRLIFNESYKISDLKLEISQICDTEHGYFNVNTHETKWYVDAKPDFDKDSNWNATEDELKKLFTLDYFEFFDDIDGIIDIKPLMNAGITFVMFGQKESILAKEKLSKHKFFKEITSKGLHLIIESIEDSYRNRGEHLFV